jgi:hypothetical protein
MLSPQNLAPGCEQHEEFYSSALHRDLVQYDYRHTDGVLFSCVKRSLEDCRAARDRWLKNRS